MEQYVNQSALVTLATYSYMGCHRKSLLPYCAVITEFQHLLHHQTIKFKELQAPLFGACGEQSSHVYMTGDTRKTKELESNPSQ
jgi:hypothetical protein